ncbi:hypothetical protein MSAN_02278800 [Mycena sanguinolenta]|uniref:Protein kinase domain-containing protein n=1 Tax=Mycena sanguinolenta TaxID=230812 RepID=A0A8H6X9R8_9AGAR|nr:hypothetical protein MSAN_02278800 [Mycena sanguinolenta]
MDLQPHFEPEPTVVSTVNNAGSTAYAGVFFPQATGFNIHGGVFTSNVTNNVYNPPPEQPSGDINLIKEFKEMRSNPQSSVVGRQISRATVRRVYKAKIEGRESGHMTVTMYEGDGAEQAWNQDRAKYEAIRHPNIMQLYGLVSTQRLYAMIFHDELIPFAQFLHRFQHSPILWTYIIGYCPVIHQEYGIRGKKLMSPNVPYLSLPFAGCDQLYFRCIPEALVLDSNAFSEFLHISSLTSSQRHNKRAVWIRPLTGGLCVDLGEGMLGTGFIPPLAWDTDVLRVENVSLDASDSEDPGFSVVKFLRNISLDRGFSYRILNLEPGYDSRRIRIPKLELRLSLWSDEVQMAWLAQANHIFAELQEREHAENYVCVYNVAFMLQIADRRNIPEGYLFVCPPQDFRTGIGPCAHLCQWPDCPAYWSLDPSGADHLSTEDARVLGFPAIHIETMIFGKSWHRSVYEGLRRLHEGKGFDPDSGEVARRLGYPLYEVLSDRVPFAAHKFKFPWCDFKDPELCRELGHYL